MAEPGAATTADVEARLRERITAEDGRQHGRDLETVLAALARVEQERDEMERVARQRQAWNEASLLRAERAEEVLRLADDFLRRLSEWDMLSAPGGKPITADGPYWQREIAKVREALAHRTNADWETDDPELMRHEGRRLAERIAYLEGELMLLRAKQDPTKGKSDEPCS